MNAIAIAFPNHAFTETMESGCQPVLACAKFDDLSLPPVQEVSSLIKTFTTRKYMIRARPSMLP